MTGPLPPRVDAIVTTAQRCYADALDLVDLGVNAIIDGDTDMIAAHVVQQRIDDAPRYALAQTVTFQAAILSAVAVALAEVGNGTAPDEIVASWRRSAAQVTNRTEARLRDLLSGGGAP